MFKIANSLDQLLKVYAVRAIVFCEEQQIPYGLEVDDHDHTALHILGEIDQEPVAAGRIRLLGDYVKFERLAIRKQYRGHGYGNQLLQYMLKVAREQGFSTFKLHAQIAALPFYEKNGFEAWGEEFLEANIAHCLMVKADHETHTQHQELAVSQPLPIQ